jgi:hypothetical protein
MLLSWKPPDLRMGREIVDSRRAAGNVGVIDHRPRVSIGARL